MCHTKRPNPCKYWRACIPAPRRKEDMSGLWRPPATPVLRCSSAAPAVATGKDVRDQIRYRTRQKTLPLANGDVHGYKGLMPSPEEFEALSKRVADLDSL